MGEFTPQRELDLSLGPTFVPKIRPFHCVCDLGMKALTKSRFIIATECPRMLQYQSDAGRRYPDAREGDEFLEALADGGHQVGALARLMFPRGQLVADKAADDQLATTSRLLTETNVTLFEGTVRYQNRLVRCDILEKTGDAVKLIEVKSKGYGADDSLQTSKGEIASEWKTYLYDVAYQAYVLAKAYPKLRITPYLMLLDKSATVAIDGLNTKLPVTTQGRQVSVTPTPGFDAALLVPPLLKLVDVSKETLQLQNHLVEVADGKHSFDSFIDSIAKGLEDGSPLPKNIGTACKTCPFYLDAAEITPERRSGWHECMREHYGYDVTAARKDTVFGLYSVRESGLSRLLKFERVELVAIGADAVSSKESTEDGIDYGQRRELQWKECHGAHEPFILDDVLAAEMRSWRWPLHFIDFETSRPALPYHAGRTPYDQILFQFSHHVLQKDGRLEHRTQYLEARPGVAPNIPVLRELQRALSGDDGTIIHWFPHERTVLADIRAQILKDATPGAGELLAFIETLIGRTESRRTGEEKGGRLTDLGMLVRRTVFYPGTGGSSSIKKVLPAALRFCEPLRLKYSTPVYGTPAIPSRNFANKRWVVMQGLQVRDPYQLLDPLFVEAALQQATSDQDEDANGSSAYIANGGAALIAYDHLQQPGLPQAERERLESQLYRYCELDTLAMVMVYEALQCRH